MRGDLIGDIAALQGGETITLSLATISEEIGEGEAGLAALQEIAEDNDCHVRRISGAVTIARHPAKAVI